MNIIQNEKAIVVTGGPGMGKTSIINHLELMGYKIVNESGRQIIKQQLLIDGSKLPWLDRTAFAQEMFLQAMADFWRTRRSQAYLFFDRGLPDAIGYLKLCKLQVPNEMWAAAKEYRYFQKVFITPPWLEIYSNDSERKQSFEEAIDTYNVMYELYNELDYDVIELAKTDVANRVEYILSHIS